MSCVVFYLHKNIFVVFSSGEPFLFTCIYRNLFWLTWFGSKAFWSPVLPFMNVSHRTRLKIHWGFLFDSLGFGWCPLFWLKTSNYWLSHYCLLGCYLLTLCNDPTLKGRDLICVLYMLRKKMCVYMCICIYIQVYILYSFSLHEKAVKILMFSESYNLFQNFFLMLI